MGGRGQGEKGQGEKGQGERRQGGENLVIKTGGGELYKNQEKRGWEVIVTENIALYFARRER